MKLSTYYVVVPDIFFAEEPLGGRIVRDADEDFPLAVQWADEEGPGARVVRRDLDTLEETYSVVELYEVPAL